MRQDNSLISVIIPVFNGESYLNEAIESVLRQIYSHLEIIIVDDGSSDRSATIAKQYTPLIRYFPQSNSGTGAARNTGLQVAKGSFIAFLDQDDMWVKNKLKVQIEAFEKEPELDLVFGHVKQFYSPELDDSLKRKIHCPLFLMPGYIPSAMLAKREVFCSVGLFETAWQIGEWANWYVRATELNVRMIMLPDLVTWRRLHNSNKGILQRQCMTEYLSILGASLERRRERDGQ